MFQNGHVRTDFPVEKMAAHGAGCFGNDAKAPILFFSILDGIQVAFPEKSWDIYWISPDFPGFWDMLFVLYMSYMYIYIYMHVCVCHIYIYLSFIYIHTHVDVICTLYCQTHVLFNPF